MLRNAFVMKLKPGFEQEYKIRHDAIWPELRAELRAAGISDYSIFRRGQDLFLVLRVADFEAAWDQLASDPVNLRWQAEVGKYFEPMPDLQSGERYAMMTELFHLE